MILFPITERTKNFTDYLFSETLLFNFNFQIRRKAVKEEYKMTVTDPSLSSRLTEAVELQAADQPDLYFVTDEGGRVPAHR